MQFYTVHEPPEPPVDRIDRAGSLVFISDKFAPAAVAFGPFWLLGNRLWQAFAAYIAALVVIGFVVIGAGLSWRWLSLMMGALNLFIGFEAASLRRWALERQGWRTLGTVSGKTLDECERRFLEGWLQGQDLPLESQRGQPGSAAPTSSGGLSSLATATPLSSSGRLDADRRRWMPWRPAR